MSNKSKSNPHPFGSGNRSRFERRQGITTARQQKRVRKARNRGLVNG